MPILAELIGNILHHVTAVNDYRFFMTKCNVCAMTQDKDHMQCVLLERCRPIRHRVTGDIPG